MYIVKYYKTTLNYGWSFCYLNRTILDLEKKGIIKVQWLDGYAEVSEKSDNLVLFYVNDYPIIVEARDNFNVLSNFRDEQLPKFKDFIILKSNYSTELWDTMPKEFDQKLNARDLKLRKHLRPFIAGRGLGKKVITYPNEFTLQDSSINSKYKVVSYSGAGMYKLEIESRLRIYELIEKVFKDDCKLSLCDRKWAKGTTDKFKQLLKTKYLPLNTDIHNNYTNYINWLKLGEFSLSFPGLQMSMPFRCVDAVIADRCIISTKIWQDGYKSFPCVELPICGYLGIGDWAKAEKILLNLDKVDQVEMKKKAKEWYDKYLSPIGFWENQILKVLEKK